MDIEKGDSRAITNLGTFYKDIEKMYTFNEKYYLMAADHGHSEAMMRMLECRHLYKNA